MNEKLLYLRAEENFYKKLVFLPGLCDRLQAKRYVDMVCLMSDIPSVRYNAIFNLQLSPNDMHSRLQEVSKLYTDKGVPFTIHVGPSSDAVTLIKALREQNFQCIKKAPVMATTLDEVTLLRNDPETLTIMDGTSQAARALRYKLMAPVDLLWAQEEKLLASVGSTKNSPYKRWVGINNAGEPVMSCVTFVDQGHCGVYDIIVVPHEDASKYITQFFQCLVRFFHACHTPETMSVFVPEVELEKRIAALSFKNVGTVDAYMQTADLL